MISGSKLEILFDISLMFLRASGQDSDLKKILSQLSKILNCVGAHIYYFDEGHDVLYFSPKCKIPRVDKLTNKFLTTKIFGNDEFEIGKDIFNKKVEDFPKQVEFEEKFFSIFSLGKVGILILKSSHDDMDEVFLKTFDLLVQELGIILEKNIIESRMQKANHLATLGQASANVSHEINNPLMILKNSVVMLESHLCTEESYEKISKVSERISKSTKRIESIVSSLKTLSRDQAEGELEKISLKELFSDVLFFSQTLLMNSAHVTCSFPSNVRDDLYVSGRTVQLSQVIINLVKNSFEEVSSKINPWVRVEFVEEDEFVKIIVTDSGAGISKEIQKKILTPFFTTKEKGVGTGLGLSISKDFLQSQGGDLYYDDSCENTSFVILVRKFFGV